MMHCMRIGVYGMGRFGAFWASVLRQRFEVYAYNRSQRPLPEGIQSCSLEELCQLDAIFLCVAISSMESVCKQIAPYLRSGTLVLDTCSVKVYPAELMQRLLPQDVNLIATHPMFGPDSGRDGVAGLPLVFSPLRCTPEQQDLWYSTFSDHYSMRVIEMSCDEHDREAAFTQGITHVIGRVLGQLELKRSQIGTTGYNSLLTIVEQTCNDPMQLFYDLQRYNPHTHQMRLALSGSLDEVMSKLAEADRVG